MLLFYLLLSPRRDFASVPHFFVAMFCICNSVCGTAPRVILRSSTLLSSIYWCCIVRCLLGDMQCLRLFFQVIPGRSSQSQLHIFKSININNAFHWESMMYQSMAMNRDTSRTKSFTSGHRWKRATRAIAPLELYITPRQWGMGMIVNDGGGYQF